MGAEFLAKHYPGPKTILTPTPTWANHDKLFPQGGLKLQKYRYYQPDTRGLDYEASLPLQAAACLVPCSLSLTLAVPRPALPCLALSCLCVATSLLWTFRAVMGLP